MSDLYKWADGSMQLMIGVAKRGWVEIRIKDQGKELSIDLPAEEASILVDVMRTAAIVCQTPGLGR
jgi:hypothetical protein